MSLKAKVEAIIYATEEPVTLNELASLLKDAVLAELQAEEAVRLALNETVSDGPPVADGEEEEALFVESPSADDRQEAVPESAPPPAEDPSAATNSTTAEQAIAAAEAIPAKSVLSGKDKKSAEEKEQLKTVKARLSTVIDELMADYASSDRGMEIRQIAGGYRMATKPEHHDAVVNFAKSLKPPVRLSLQALETLAVIAYKQPVTVPEISEVRAVDSAGVIATLLDRKLITTAGRKQVIGRPILYKTTKEFLMRFGLNNVAELPSVEEFEKLGDPQAELFSTPAAEPSSPEEPVTEAVPEPGSHLMGETVVPAAGSRITEGEAVAEVGADPQSENGFEETTAEEVEPVTEAVPEVTHHHLAGESTMPVDGTYATEAEPEPPGEKP
jgi:segregation and condensation protein B